MTEQQHLQDLSASVDGELAPHEWRFLLRRLDRDAAMCEVWSRYQLMGESLRGHLVLTASSDFSARVLAAIKDEATHAMTVSQQVHESAARRWLRWSMGGAIAASVAVAALMLAQPNGEPAQGVRTAATLPSGTRGMNVAVTEQNHDAATPALGAPAAVPAWLNLDPAVRLSQRAAATRGRAANDMHWMDGDTQPPDSYPAIRTGRDSYLLLLDPQAAGRAAAARH